MMALQTFTFQSKAPIRGLLKDGEPWLVATDVARALGYSNPTKAVRDHCKGTNETFVPSASGDQLTKIIREGDAFRLIMRSKLPAAQAFEAWVMDEVLPALRREGRYEVPQQALPLPGLGSEPDAAVLSYLESPARVFQHKGQPWVIAKDFCRACGYAWHSGGVLIARVPEAQKGLVLVSAITHGSKQHTLALSIEGVGLFAKSAKFPESRGFYLWMRSLRVADLPVVPVAPTRKLAPRHIRPELAYQPPTDPIWRPSAEDRAGFAEKILEHHRRTADLRDERFIYGAHMPQIMADLMHLAEQKNLDWPTIIAQANEHFHAERSLAL